MDPNAQPQPTVPTTSPSPSGFPLRTIALIVILIAIVSALLYIALSPKNQTPVTTNNIMPTTTVSVAHTTLTLTQGSTPASGSAKTIDVQINTGADAVTAVQLDIIYDPTAIGNVTIAAPTNPFFASPVIFPGNKVDAKLGKISYAVGIQPTGHGLKGTGVVATITYTPLLTSGTTPLSFGQNTQVTAEGQTKSVLKQATGTSINLSL